MPIGKPKIVQISQEQAGERKSSNKDNRSGDLWWLPRKDFLSWPVVSPWQNTRMVLHLIIVPDLLHYWVNFFCIKLTFRLRIEHICPHSKRFAVGADREKEERTAPAGDPRRGTSALIYAEPLHRAWHCMFAQIKTKTLELL